MRDRLGRRNRRAVAVALFLVLVSSGCGSRRSTDEFAAIYAGTNGAGLGAAGSAAGNGSGTSSGASTSGGGTGAGGASSSGGGAGVSGSSGGDVAGDAGAGASTGEGGAAGAPVAPGAPIRIASVGTFGGPVGAAVGGGTRAVQAWAAAVNAAGGVNGHPIELFVAEDGGDPARHRSLVQEMVEDRDVVAFVHNPAPLSGQAAVPYLEQHGIPVLGSEGGSPWLNSSPMYFPQMSSDTILSESFGRAVGAYGAANGLTNVAIITCAEIQGCDSSAAAAPFEAAGLNVVYRTRASLAQPDYTSQCLNARNAGAQILFLGMDGQSVQRIADNCNSVGFQPVFGEVSQAVISAHASKPNLNGMLTPQNVAPWFQTSNPAVAEFVQAMTNYAPGVDINGTAMQGWVSAKLFEAAVLNATDPTTAEGLLEGLYALDGNDLGGLTQPLTFEPGAPNNAGNIRGCWWDVRIDGGQFVSPNNGERTCP